MVRHAGAVAMVAGDDDAVPGLYRWAEGRPGPVVLTLEVDGEVFAVREGAGGDTAYDWVSGPNDGYGFGSSGSPTRPVAEHEETIRTFLAQIDPETGYIGDA
jgi:hypothetical protein